MSTEHTDIPRPVTATMALPGSVHRIELEGREIFLVGTAHVSPQSVTDVEKTLEIVRPDTVAIELCEPRYRNLREPQNWKRLNILQVLREGKAMLLLSSLLMTSFQRRIAEQLGVEPGAEMLAAARGAEESGAKLELIDRGIEVTLRRAAARLGFWSKLKVMGQLFAGLVVSEKIDAEEIEELKESEKLQDALQMLADEFPLLKETLIDERDAYMAEKLRHLGGERIVAVVGAGHIEGMKREIATATAIDALDVVPPPSIWPRILKWAIPAVIVGLLAYGFVTGGSERSLESIGLWVLINGALSALGAALAFGHPLTVLSAFVAAPLTSLNPLIAAGWVAGLVQAWVKKPTVEDLEQLPGAITSLKGFWSNAVTRVLLVVALSNLGSTLGTFIAGSWIAARTIS